MGAPKVAARIDRLVYNHQVMMFLIVMIVPDRGEGDLEIRFNSRSVFSTCRGYLRRFLNVVGGSSQLYFGHQSGLAKGLTEVSSG
jgi:hypothetical protein